jgi:acyl transferase domain-containing protein
MANPEHKAEEQRIARWTDGIAIVGMSARFPGARNVQEFQE